MNKGGLIMKHFDKLHTPSRIIEFSCQVTPIQDSLTETDILDLQEKFLSNGFKHIRVKSMKEGRALVHRFLSSLSIYHNVAYVAMENVTLQTNYTNVYYELMRSPYLNSFKPSFSDEFFIEEFYFDFMWIEATEELLRSSWYKYLKKKLLDFKLDQNIPMMVLLSSV